MDMKNTMDAIALGADLNPDLQANPGNPKLVFPKVKAW
jgi:hypothetical protein